ncbi:MAG TPA: MerR family transcriptional regulator [Kineosporiaceae bacterium]|nr:MerR family transcriptional regulator [Kineosporiaceae bacterium]
MTSAASEPRHRVEALEEITGIKVRTIRLWQDRGLITAPLRVGRIAYYDDDHVLRLQLIDRLLRRGYTLNVIGELLEAWEKGRNLEDILGFESVVGEPWTTETPSEVSILELHRMFGWQLTPSVVSQAIELGIIKPHGLRSFQVPSPALLAAGEDLVAAGIPLQTVIDVVRKVQEELDRPADRLVDMVSEHLFPAGTPAGLPEGADLTRVIATITTLRPHAIRAVDAMFSNSLKRSMDRLFASVTDQAVPNRGGRPDTDVRDGG